MTKFALIMFVFAFVASGAAAFQTKLECLEVIQNLQGARNVTLHLLQDDYLKDTKLSDQHADEFRDVVATIENIKSEIEAVIEDTLGVCANVP